MTLSKLYNLSEYSFLLCKIGIKISSVHLLVRIRNNIFDVPSIVLKTWYLLLLIIHINNLEESKACLKMSSS